MKALTYFSQKTFPVLFNISLTMILCLFLLVLSSCNKNEDEIYNDMDLKSTEMELLSLSVEGDLYYGPETFYSIFKQTVVETRSLSNSNFEYFENFVLKVQNGNSPNTKVKTIEIKIDGVTVVTSEDFKKNVRLVTKQISLTPTSELEVILEGNKGRFISLLIEGTLNKKIWNVITIPNSQLVDNTTQPSLYDGTIAWHDGTYNGALMFWDGANTTQVATGVFAGQIFLHKRQIAYIHNEGPNNGTRVYFWDGNNSINIASSIWSGGIISHNNGKIVFIGTQGGILEEGAFQIYYWDGAVTTQVTSELCGGPISELFGIPIAWIDCGKIFYFNGIETTIIFDSQDTERTLIDWPVSLFDGEIAFSAYDGNDFEIYLWDGVKIIQVTDNDFEDKKPSLYNGSIAWQAILGSDEYSREIFYWDGNKSYQITDNFIPDQYPSLFNENIAWNSGSAWNGSGQICYATQVK